MSAAGIAGLFSRRAGLAPFPWLGNYELRGPGEQIEPRRWKRGESAACDVFPACRTFKTRQVQCVTTQQGY